MTCGRGWQTARVAGTHRSPVSFGGGVRAWAAVGASAATSRAAIARVRPCGIFGDNRSDAAKSRRGGECAGFRPRPRRVERHRLNPATSELPTVRCDAAARLVSPPSRANTQTRAYSEGAPPAAEPSPPRRLPQVIAAVRVPLAAGQAVASVLAGVAHGAELSASNALVLTADGGALTADAQSVRGQAPGDTVRTAPLSVPGGAILDLCVSDLRAVVAAKARARSIAACGSG